MKCQCFLLVQELRKQDEVFNKGDCLFVDEEYQFSLEQQQCRKLAVQLLFAT